MIPLSTLSDPSDLVAFVSLALLAIAFGLLPSRIAMGPYVRQRRMVALLFGIAGLRRAATFLHLQEAAVGLWIALAVISAVAVVAALLDLWRTRRGHLR